MFSSKKFLSLIGAAGLAFGASACSSSSGGGSITGVCVDDIDFLAAVITATYSFIAGETEIPDEVVDQDVLDESALISICAEVGVTDANPTVEADAAAPADIEGSDPSAECTGIPVEIDETTFEASGTADITVYGENDFSEEDCDDLEGTYDTL
ncbi:MAG: hypothetical protein KIT79_09270 [Deltaproteobacteria bacterium]|nr:hypothetical protein [Deltaproteobacteria bacterium]